MKKMIALLLALAALLGCTACGQKEEAGQKLPEGGKFRVVHDSESSRIKTCLREGQGVTPWRAGRPARPEWRRAFS